MSGAPMVALLFALALGGAAAAGVACASPRMDGDAQRDAATEVLILSKTAIAAAVRRTAVADPDLDGVVTSREAARYYDTRFRLLDESGDGTIDEVEFLRAAAVRSLYTLDGLATPRPLAFESVDVDGNGVVTPEEFLRAEMVRRIAGGIEARRQAIFEAVDTDRDGVLSQHEFMAAGIQDFEGSDADGDGNVTIWEFYAATRL
jgi:hypothetical protein